VPNCDAIEVQTLQKKYHYRKQGKGEGAVEKHHIQTRQNAIVNKVIGYRHWQDWRQKHIHLHQ
jgi:hypothetical protein